MGRQRQHEMMKFVPMDVKILKYCINDAIKMGINHYFCKMLFVKWVIIPFNY